MFVYNFLFFSFCSGLDVYTNNISFILFVYLLFHIHHIHNVDLYANHLGLILFVYLPFQTTHRIYDTQSKLDHCATYQLAKAQKVIELISLFHVDTCNKVLFIGLVLCTLVFLVIVVYKNAFFYILHSYMVLFQAYEIQETDNNPLEYPLYLYSIVFFCICHFGLFTQVMICKIYLFKFLFKSIYMEMNQLCIQQFFCVSIISHSTQR